MVIKENVNKGLDFISIVVPAYNEDVGSNHRGNSNAT